MVDRVSVRFKNARVEKKPLNIRIQWNAGTACVSECVPKTLACRGLRVGPSKSRPCFKWSGPTFHCSLTMKQWNHEIEVMKAKSSQRMLRFIVFWSFALSFREKSEICHAASLSQFNSKFDHVMITKAPSSALPHISPRWGPRNQSSRIPQTGAVLWKFHREAPGISGPSRFKDLEVLIFMAFSAGKRIHYVLPPDSCEKSLVRLQ